MSQIDVGKFSQKQQKALTSLLSGMSQAEAAKVAGVSLRTIQRYLADDDFSQVLRDNIGSAVSLAAARLASLSDTAVGVLAETMESETATTSQRLRAANFLLLHLLKLGDYSDISARIDKLEARLENSAEPPTESDSRQGT